MKNLLIAIALGGMFTPGAAMAIPDRVSTGIFNVFFQQNGVNLEDHALSNEAWSESGLKGKWRREAEEDRQSLEAYLLEVNAVVFGVQASQVRILKSDGDLHSFLIRFQADGKQITDGEEILKILRKNVEAYTGKQPADAKDKSCRFVYKEFNIALSESGSDSVLISIRRLPA